MGKLCKASKTSKWTLKSILKTHVARVVTGADVFFPFVLVKILAVV